MSDCLLSVRGRFELQRDGERQEVPAHLIAVKTKFRSLDGRSFEVPAEAACLSDYLRTYYETTSADEELVLPLKGELLDQVVEYLLHHRAERPGVIKLPLDGRLSECGASSWDEAFMKVNRKNQHALNLAAKMLGIQSLFLLTAAAIALKIKEQNTSQVRTALDALDDMSSVEEDQIHESFKQACMRVYPWLPADAEHVLLGTAAIVQGATLAAEQNTSLKDESGAGIDPRSWRHAMWRSAALWDWQILDTAPDAIREDQDLLLEAVRFSGKALSMASDSLKADGDFVLKCITLSGEALAYASPALRADRELVLQAAKAGQGAALAGAADKLREDRDFVFEVIVVAPEAFKYASEQLQNDRQFALLAASTNGLVLQYMSSRFKADREIAAAAVLENPAASQYVHVSRREELGLVDEVRPKVCLMVDRAGETVLGPPLPIRPCDPPTWPLFVRRINKVVFFSAGSTLTGNLGQNNYVAANALLDKVPAYERPEIDSVTNQAGTVDGIGMRLRAFGSMDVMLQSNTDMIITITEARAILGHVIAPMDSPEWLHWQPMGREQRDGYLALTAGIASQQPGGGWKPAETYADVVTVAGVAGQSPVAKGDDLRGDTTTLLVRDKTDEKAVPARPPEKTDCSTPLGGWPGMVQVASAQVQTHQEGVLVMLTGVGAKNGTRGTLIKRSGLGRWKVKLDSGGNALLREQYLQIVEPTPHTEAVVPSRDTADPKRGGAQVLSPLALSEPPKAKDATAPERSCWAEHKGRYFIMGSWNSWQPQEMQWEELRQCYKFRFQIGPTGFERFLLLLDGSQQKCLHPAGITEGCPDFPYDMAGPHPLEECSCKYWVVGRTKLHQGICGEIVEVRAAESTVEWERWVEWSADFDHSKLVVSGDGWIHASAVKSEMQNQMGNEVAPPKFVQRPRFSVEKSR